LLRFARDKLRASLAMTFQRSRIFLIVNADDFGLVPSVSEGILEAHAKGIVSSTTALITRPISSKLIQRAKKYSRLGIGIHLNITLGEPLSRAKDARSLTNSQGVFSKLTAKSLRKIKAPELEREWTLQILRFRRLWGELPTHFDTHHHIHAYPKIAQVFLAIAQKFKRPFRLPSLRFPKPLREKFWRQGILLPQDFFGNLDAKKHWTETTLQKALRRVKPGVHELMCHPGVNSNNLRGISSFQEGRERELEALTSRAVLETVGKRKIQLIHFGYLK
jgi:predicted glycoside hydrolase/deacetylase ChbG (UPF0249 family)